MPFIVKPLNTTTIIREKTETRNGEITVNLNLTLTLVVDQNGNLSLTATPSTDNQQPSPKPNKPEYVIQLPDIEITDNLILDFGKDV